MSNGLIKKSNFPLKKNKNNGVLRFFFTSFVYFSKWRFFSIIMIYDDGQVGVTRAGPWNSPGLWIM